jgi:hypothetical protein
MAAFAKIWRRQQALCAIARPLARSRALGPLLAVTRNVTRDGSS